MSPAVVVFFVLASGAALASWNDPYPKKDNGKNILYSSFRERPKHFDPARSYSSNEYAIIGQIYEPPFQYHYLKRPYTLVPLTATGVPRARYYDSGGKQLPANAPVQEIAYSIYQIRIRPGIYYQPHPCFARAKDGRYLYQSMAASELRDRYTIADFPHTGTRELTAADYVYQIKRLAHPKLHSPILSLMNEYIVGLREYAEILHEAYVEQASRPEQGVYLDLTRYPLEGVDVVDRYTYRVKIRGKYPQFLYWMAMPFFAPLPPEADRFFSQPGMADRNLTLQWYPVGTGAYMLTVNNPNLRMVLERNPNFHDERYPAEGSSADRAAGLLKDAGIRLPFIDRVVYSLEKEGIPRWNKFLQGYYDQSGVLTESFDQTIQFSPQGDTELTEAMQARGIRLLTTVGTSTYYTGFNLLDPIVGGYSEEKRKLRRAISIAVDEEERISIFLNGRGIPAQSPLPPGIFGFEHGCGGRNQYVYDCVGGKAQRKPIEEARRLLAEAGYPEGRDPRTGRPLLLYFDAPAFGPEDKAILDWTIKQYKKLGIQLVPRVTDYNRFQEKMHKGNAQIYRWGWNADYPDPENFLFLLYGPNKKVGADGENASNYEDPEFDRLFERMKNMDNTPERLQIVGEMLTIARRDAPWIWGLHPKRFTLEHGWLHNSKPHNMANNTMKYLRLDPQPRAQKRQAWNKAIVWPIGLLAVLMAAGAVPAIVTYVRREKRAGR
ncbi:MAG: ABC transporter substrate-binding protein [Acidiferrobacterales bacterium]